MWERLCRVQRGEGEWERKGRQLYIEDSVSAAQYRWPAAVSGETGVACDWCV